MTEPELTSESTVYVLYIASTPEQVWNAITSSAFTTQYFFGRSVESDWNEGSAWNLRKEDGTIDVWGLVRKADPPRTLVVTWNVRGMEGQQQTPPPECVVTYQVEEAGDGVVRLTMTEAHPTPIPVEWLEGGRRGWPMILSGLKSLLETGRPLPLNIPSSPQSQKR